MLEQLKPFKAKNGKFVSVSIVANHIYRHVIIISTVRSNPDFLHHDNKFNLGFLGDPKRFNVAMTRSKALLVVIGNGMILAQDPCWNTWLKVCHQRGLIKNCTSELVSSLDKKVQADEGSDEEEEDGDIVKESFTAAGWRDLE